MSISIVWLIYLLAGLVCGFFIGYFIRRLFIRGKISSAEMRAEELLKSAKNKQQEIILKAKEEALKIIDDIKR